MHALQRITPYLRRARRLTAVFRGLNTFVDPDYVLTYIASGGAKFSFDEAQFSVEPGDLVLMPPYFLHMLETGPGQELEQLIFHLDLFYTPDRMGEVRRDPEMSYERYVENRANPETLLAALPPVVRPLPDRQYDVRRLCEHLLWLHQQPGGDAARQLMTKARLLEILAIYLQPTETAAAVATGQAFSKGWRKLEKAIAYAHARYAEPITTGEASRVAGLSVAHFCHLFKRYTRCTFKHYLAQYRVNQAKALIRKGGMNFTEIAASVGFSSIQQFSRTFRACEHMTPTQYAKDVR